MKILILSDLHLEFGNSFTTPAVDYDLVVLAGDINAPGHKAVHWAKRESTFGGRPVVFVPGNHEFYGTTMGAELDEMREAAEESNVHVLSRGFAVIEGIRFLGCVLWTDFLLPAAQADGSMDTNVASSLAAANRRMNDFARIDVAMPAGGQYRERKRLLRAEDTLAMHWVDRDWLRRQLSTPFDGPTVVVTHHAPSSGSVAAKYAGDELTPTFVSGLPEEMFDVPSLWIHGHTHDSSDYHCGRCRVVSNPRGYLRRDGSFENIAFNASLVVDI